MDQQVNVKLASKADVSGFQTFEKAAEAARKKTGELKKEAGSIEIKGEAGNSLKELFTNIGKGTGEVTSLTGALSKASNVLKLGLGGGAAVGIGFGIAQGFKSAGDEVVAFQTKIEAATDAILKQNEAANRKFQSKQEEKIYGKKSDESQVLEEALRAREDLNKQFKDFESKRGVFGTISDENGGLGGIFDDKSDRLLKFNESLIKINKTISQLRENAKNVNIEGQDPDKQASIFDEMRKAAAARTAKRDARGIEDTNNDFEAEFKNKSRKAEDEKSSLDEQMKGATSALGDLQDKLREEFDGRKEAKRLKKEEEDSKPAMQGAVAGSLRSMGGGGGSYSNLGIRKKKELEDKLDLKNNPAVIAANEQISILKALLADSQERTKQDRRAFEDAQVAMRNEELARKRATEDQGN